DIHIAAGSRRMNGSFSAESLCGSSSCRSLRKNPFQTSRSPSFPHAFSGNPGEFLTGPPIRTFGGENFGINYHKCFCTPVAQLLKFSRVAVVCEHSPRRSSSYLRWTP